MPACWTLRSNFPRAAFAILAALAFSPGFEAFGSARAAEEPGRGRERRTGGEPGFLVVAPDRGFLGNEELRDAFEAFAPGRKAALVFVTDDRTRAGLQSALRTLAGAGAQRVVALPFFLSRADPRFRLLESLVPERTASGVPVSWARPFGESYFAVEALADHLRAVQEPAGRRLVVVGAGAKDEESGRRMAADWQRLAELAAEGLGFESVRVVVAATQSEVRPGLAAAVEGGARPVIVPFHLGSKLDGMMSFSASVREWAPEGAEVIDGDVTPHPVVGHWMQREANGQVALRSEEVGVVVLAHGADHHWNETMRQAVAPLAGRYKVEPAFSMADPQVIERAVRRLEKRGARAIVVLRVFGLAASFRDSVERLLGIDCERGGPPRAAQPPHHGHAGEHAMGPPPPRIRSGAVLTTVGGIEDDPLFAQALLERARALSRDPAKETLILVAHGAGDDAMDRHWHEILASIASRMHAMGGDLFRAIHAATWREDWPEKRRPAVETVRRLVEEASRDGGSALVVPARTLGQGPERRLLDGLTFRLGEGFAPHPLFARWAAARVAGAVRELAAQARAARKPAEESSPSRAAARP